jgi:hypothetical protein
MIRILFKHNKSNKLIDFHKTVKSIVLFILSKKTICLYSNKKKKKKKEQDRGSKKFTHLD